MIKGRKILLAYINEASSNPNDNLCMDIETARIFDEIKLSTYRETLNDTPSCNLSPKPIAILDAMNRMGDSDILLYSETSIPSYRELKKWFKRVAKNSALFFFHGKDIGMEKMLMHDFYYKAKFFPFYHLDGKLFLLKKSSQYLIEEWRDRMANLEADDEQHVNESKVLSNIIFNHLDDENIKILFDS